MSTVKRKTPIMETNRKLKSKSPKEFNWGTLRWFTVEGSSLSNGQCETWMANVPGGWLVRVVQYNEVPISSNLTFVPRWK